MSKKRESRAARQKKNKAKKSSKIILSILITTFTLLVLGGLTFLVLSKLNNVSGIVSYNIEKIVQSGTKISILVDAKLVKGKEVDPIVSVKLVDKNNNEFHELNGFKPNNIKNGGKIAYNLSFFVPETPKSYLEIESGSGNISTLVLNLSGDKNKNDLKISNDNKDLVVGQSIDLEPNYQFIIKSYRYEKLANDKNNTYIILDVYVKNKGKDPLNIDSKDYKLVTESQYNSVVNAAKKALQDSPKSADSKDLGDQVKKNISFENTYGFTQVSPVTQWMRPLSKTLNGNEEYSGTLIFKVPNTKIENNEILIFKNQRIFSSGG